MYHSPPSPHNLVANSGEWLKGIGLNSSHLVNLDKIHPRFSHQQKPETAHIIWLLIILYSSDITSSTCFAVMLQLHVPIRLDILCGLLCELSNLIMSFPHQISAALILPHWGMCLQNEFSMKLRFGHASHDYWFLKIPIFLWPDSWEFLFPLLPLFHTHFHFRLTWISCVVHAAGLLWTFDGHVLAIQTTASKTEDPSRCEATHNVLISAHSDSAIFKLHYQCYQKAIEPFIFI